MKVILTIALCMYLMYQAHLNAIQPETCESLIVRAKKLDRDIVKLKQDINKLDIMQGSTAEFIARVDKMAQESERKRKLDF